MAAPTVGNGSSPAPKSIQAAADIDGVHTELVYTEYDNYLFVLLTQYKKIGTLVEAKSDVLLEEAGGPSTFTTNVLLGKDIPVMHVVARSLAAKIGKSKTMLFGLSFKNENESLLRAAEKFALEHIPRKV